MKRLGSILLALVMVMALVSCGSKTPNTPTGSAGGSGNTPGGTQTAAPKVLKVSVGSVDSSPINRSLVYFCDLLKEKSGGTITGEVYGSAQLAGGNQTTVIEMTQSGDIEVGVICGVIQASMLPDFNLTLVPWVWDNLDMVDEALAYGSDVFQAYYDKFLEKDLILLAFGENGFRQVTNGVRAIETPGDMDNIKIRVLGNAMLQAVYTELGSNPTDYNFNELYTAMQQGTVEGQENPITTIIVPSKFYEVQDYMSLWNICYDTENMCIGRDLWESFTEEEQSIIQECAIEWAQYNKDLARSEEADALTFLADYMEITAMDAAQIAPFKEIAKPISDQFTPSWDAELYNAILSYSKG